MSHHRADVRHPKRFVTDAELASLTLRRQQGDDPVVRVAIGVEIAWALRERDTTLALEMADDLMASAHSLGRARLALVQSWCEFLTGSAEDACQRAAAAAHAFDLLNDPVGLSDAYCMLGEIHADLGNGNDRVECMERSSAYALLAEDEGRVRAALARKLMFDVDSDSDAAAVKWYAHAREVIQSGCDDEAALASGAAAKIDLSRGAYASALRHIATARRRAGSCGQQRLAISSAARGAMLLLHLQDVDSASDWAQDAVAIARRCAWPSQLGTALTAQAAVLGALGKERAAREAMQEAFALLKRRKGTVEYARALLCHGRLLQDAGEQAAAVSAFTEVASHPLADLDLKRQSLRALISVLVGGGRRDEATGAIRRYEDLMRGRPPDPGHVEALRWMARHETLGGDGGSGYARALECLDAAAACAEDIDGFSSPAAIFEDMATLHAQAGNFQAAYKCAQQAKVHGDAFQHVLAQARVVAMEVRQTSERERVEQERLRHEAAESEARARTLTAANSLLETLSSVGREITAQLEQSAVFRVLEERASVLIGAVDIWVYLFDGASQALTLVHCSQDTENQNARWTELAWSCVQGRAPQMMSDELVSQLSVGTQPVGAVVAHLAGARADHDRARLIMDSLCAYAAIALLNANAYQRLNKVLSALRIAQDELLKRNIDLEKAYGSLEEVSLTDPLTGLHNRRFLERQIETDVALCRRRQSAPVAPGAVEKRGDNRDIVFFLCDLDHFKAVNDRYGHHAGDLVLQQMRDRLRRVFRESDYLVRWGGEEFLIVARETDRSRAAALAERIRISVESEPFDLGAEESVQKTCSIGFAGYPFVPADPGRFSWTQVLEMADQALYLAKRHGRNGWVGLSVGPKAPAGAERLVAAARACSEDTIGRGELVVNTNLPKLVELRTRGAAEPTPA